MPSPQTKRLLPLLARFSGRRVLVLGDLMLDHFVRGKVARISPEAPVPVVQVHTETHAPGGAGNVASNLSSLGAAVSVFSVVGDDAAARHLVGDLEERGVDTSGIRRDPSRVTTQKSRVVAEHQQVVRFDRETVRRLEPVDERRLLAALSEALPVSAALVLSDYGKGIVTASVVRHALRLARKAGVHVLVDPKVEHFRRYRGVDCMTPNLLEASGGMHVALPKDESALIELGGRILKSLRLRSVLITRGEKGMTLFEAAGSRPKIFSIPTQAREVFDVTGAGDTVISVMALALASGARLPEAAVLANVAAGIVVGKLSTATTTVEEIRRGVLDWARRPLK